MDKQASELIEKIRQQFNSGPYPRNPLEQSPKADANQLFIHSLVTPFYLRNQKVVDTDDKIILDAGCGSGYTSLILAEANPGAKIVGIDLSAESVKLARQRLQYHKFENVEFHVLDIEGLSHLGLEFDYINCDEVLYLFPEPSVGLCALKSVLKPSGIIRANLHSSLQRVQYYRAQEVFRMMGLMDKNPGEFEIAVIQEMMNALKDQVLLKANTWNSMSEKDEQWFMMNYLFQGDKGYTISEMFSALKTSNLEFISMVNWRQWELLELFKAPDDLPVFLALSLPNISVEEKLHLFELLHPIHRLLDFWCAHPNQAHALIPVTEWTPVDWQTVRVHLHPCLKTSQIKEDLMKCIDKQRSFNVSSYITISGVPITVESHMAACLLPLWEGAQTLTSLTERWLKIRPLHPATLEPVSEEAALNEVKELLSRLEVFLYVLLQRLT